MYEALAKQSFAASHPDQLIFIICEMLERDLQPSASLVHSAIRACCEWAVPRLAVELAEKIEANSRDGRRVDASCWVDILISSAENHFVSASHFLNAHQSSLESTQPLTESLTPGFLLQMRG